MEHFFVTFIDIFMSGGILMIPLLLLALFLYYSGFAICFRLTALNKICSNSLSFASAFSDFSGSADSQNKSLKNLFKTLRLEMMSGVERRLLTLKLLSSVAPLIGLLGTVSGMMLSIASAAGNSADVADGISRALITTQAGLVVAIPAWIMAMFAAAQSQKLLITLARRESDMIKESAL